jgi:hypothetical protein
MLRNIFRRAATRPSRGPSIRPCSRRDAGCNDDGERGNALHKRPRSLAEREGADLQAPH